MNWLYYLLEANFYLALFYALYQLLLRRDTWYQLNRSYLLFSSAASFILPFLQLGILKPRHEAPAGLLTNNIISVLPAAIPLDTQNTPPPVPPVNYYVLIYLLIAFIAALLFLFKLLQLMRLSRTGRQVSNASYRVIELDDEGRAFSFFNWLFISKKYHAADIIMRHELVHVRQWHSIDVIYSEVLKIICWFNPAVYLLQHSLKELHEYIADSQIAASLQGIDNYTDFLVNNAYGLLDAGLANNFFGKNILKKRIMMLHRKPSGNLARLKLLTVLPLMAFMLSLSTLAFSKSYGYFDLAPSKPVENASQTKLNITVVPIPIGLPIASKTDKGYHYKQSFLLLPRKVIDIGVTIIDNDGTEKEFRKLTASTADVNLLKNHFGYVFPETVVTNTSAKPAQIVEYINPARFLYSTLKSVASRFYDKGYVMTFKKVDDGKQLHIGLETMPTLQWHAAAGATFRLEELKKSHLYIAVGADLKDKNVFVRSVPANQVRYTPPVIKPDAHVRFPQLVVKSDTGKADAFHSLYTFLVAHMHYPAASRENHVQGRVIVQFNVEEDHTVKNVTLLRQLADDIDAEVISTMKKAIAPEAMKPGTNYSFPISFVLNEDAIQGKPVLTKMTDEDYKPTGFPQVMLSELTIMGNRPNQSPPKPGVNQVRFPTPKPKVDRVRFPAPKPKVDQVRFPKDTIIKKSIFKPNAAGNNLFKPNISDAAYTSFTVCNKFGKKVFSSTPATPYWDGLTNGELLKGTYFWLADSKEKKGEIVLSYKGFVTVE